MIAADTELTRRFADGDPEAVRALTGRYGAAVGAAVASSVASDAILDVVTDVFVRGLHDPPEPGSEFGPWLAGLARERAGGFDERAWALAMAVAAVDPAVRPALRDHHLSERPSPLDDDLARHELRLQRRLGHLGEAEEVVLELAEPNVWNEPGPDLAARVLAATAEPVGADTDDAPPTADSTGHATPSSGVVPRPGRISRGLRPALIGLGGAVIVLFVAIIGLSAASGTPETANFTVELTPTGALVDVEGGEITVTERSAGIEIALDAVTLPRRAGGLYYEGRVVLDDGREITAGTFAQGDDVTLWVGTSLTEARVFRVVAGDLDDPGAADVILKADLPAG